MKQYLWTSIRMLTAAIGLVPLLGYSQQPDSKARESGAGPVLVTLYMNWKRGDSHYGANAIQLSTPCQNSTDERCQCFADFKSTTTKEFADYVESFGDVKVPATYRVSYSPDGSARSAFLESVGKWPGEKFQHNERLIGAGITFRKGLVGQMRPAKVASPADCFPAQEK